MGADRFGGRGAQQVGKDLGLAALLAGLELDLAAEHVDRGLEVDDASDGLSSPCTVRGAARRRRRLGARDREPGTHPGALVDRLATRAAPG
jgi:hypothetical protein